MSLIIVTGATKGFGKAVSVAFAQQHGKKELFFVLSGRSLEELNHTKDAIIHHYPKDTAYEPLFALIVHDFTETKDFLEGANKLFLFPVSFGDLTFDEIYFFNNHASLGPLSNIGSESLTAEAISQTLNLNVSCFCFLTSEFVKRYYCVCIFSFLRSDLCFFLFHSFVNLELLPWSDLNRMH
jgi:NAD(P)-dependent dehydrogenase (short-subunit alcohol dehydrogenase family)